MNYLAHLVLGGLEPERALGNFVGDAVKGSAWRSYPERVQEGIRLHRRIDALADAHPAAQATRGDLRPRLGRWSGVALDLMHDHFLAKDFDRVTGYPGGLHAFGEEAHGVLLAQRHRMPERSRGFLDAMVEQDWLRGYADREVMRDVCRAMDRRVSVRMGVKSNLEEMWEVWEGHASPAVWEQRFLGCWGDLRVWLAEEEGRGFSLSGE